MTITPAALGSALANPYASGISFGGKNVTPVWNAATGTYGIPVAGGFAPIYNAQQFGSLVDPQSGALKGTQGQNFGSYNPAQAISGQGSGIDIQPGMSMAINSGGKKTDVGYTLDPKTGYYIPSNTTQESTAPGLLDNIIKYGAIIGGAAAGGLNAAYGGGNSALSLSQSGLTSGGDLTGTGGMLTGAGSTAATGAQSSGLSGNIGPNGSYSPSLDPYANPGPGVPGGTGTFNPGSPITSNAGGAINYNDPGFDMGGQFSSPAPIQDLSTPPTSNPLSQAKTVYDRVKLAQNLMKLGQTVTGGQQGASGGAGSRSSMGGGMSSVLKMMLEANAQAQMNGQPAPFPAFGDKSG